VRFWDSSAVVPLCVAEPHSANARSLLEGDPAVAVWWATRTECLSALTRRMREGGLAPAGFRAARRVLAALAETWVELLPSEAVRATAERLLAVHALGAADAFQLGAALAWCGGQPSRHEIVTLDIRLRDAASREGFDAFPDGD
jgi:predicted nucleic acid-binding protein